MLWLSDISKMAWLKLTRPFWLKCCCSGSCRARLFGGSFLAFVALLFCRLVARLGAAFVLLAAFRLLAAAGLAVMFSVMGSGAGFGSLDGLLPGLHGLSFGGLQVDNLLNGNIGNRNFALFLAAILLLCLFGAGLSLAALMLFSALRLGFSICGARLGLSALRLLPAFRLGLSALMLLAAAVLLEGDKHLGGFHQLGGNNFLAFNHESFGAYGFGIESLGILDYQCGHFVGTCNDGGHGILASATSGGEYCCTNGANKERFFHDVLI